MSEKKPLCLYTDQVREMGGTDVFPLSAIPTPLTGKDADTLDGYHAASFLQSVTPHKVLSTIHSDTVAADPVLGDLMHGNVTPAWARLPGNITTTRKFLRQIGTGDVSAAPEWDTLQASDIPDISATYVPYTGATADVNLGVRNFITTGTLGAGIITGISPLTIVGSASVGAEVRLREGIGNGTNYIAFKAPDALGGNYTYQWPATYGTPGYFLQTDGAGGLVFASPAGGFADPMSAAGDLIYRDTTNATTRLAVGTEGKILTATNVGGTIVPQWAAAPAGLSIGGDDSPVGQIQYRSSGNFAANDYFYFDPGSNYELYIIGAKAGAKRLYLRNTNDGTGSSNGINIGNDSAADQLSLYINSSTYSSYGGYSYLWSKANAPMIFAVNNAEVMRLSGTYVNIVGLTASQVVFTNANKNLVSSAPAALTKVNDTNVTLTLGGTPATSLLQAASLTLGWTGYLAEARGGLGSDISGISTGLLKKTGANTYTSISDFSSNWNTAYGWGDHAGLYTPLAHKTTEDAINGLVFVNGAGTYSAKVIGTDVQAYSAKLASLAGLSYSSASFVKMTGTNTFTLDTATYEPTLTKGNMTATSPILVDNTRQVIGGTVVISHAVTAGNIHLPTGGASNQILKNSGTSGTGTWGTVTENSGALASVTTINMSGALTSTLASGSAPFVVASNTVVANLNVSFLEGHAASYFQVAGSYQPLSTNLTSLAGLSYVSASFVKMTGANAFTLDTSTYEASGAVATHAALTTGIHGVGASTVASVANIATHAALITGVHGLVFTAGKTLTLTESLTFNAAGAGALRVATAANTIGNLAVGLTTQILVGGGAGTNPAWGTDLPTAVTIGSGYIYRASGTDVAVADGGTNKSSWTLYSIPYASGTTTIGEIAISTAGKVLAVNAGANGYIWASSLTNPMTNVGDMIIGGVAGAPARLADVAVGSYLASGGVNTAPAWATLNQAAVAGLTTTDGPTFAHLHISDLAAIYTAAESWIGPSSTAGIYFKGGCFGFNETSPTHKIEAVGDFQISSNAQTFFSTFLYTTSPADSIIMRMIRGRGTKASPAVVASGDTIGSIVFEGVDGVGPLSYTTGASIVAVVDGTPGFSDMPGRLELRTTPDGSNVPVTNMTIYNDGRVVCTSSVQATSVILTDVGDGYVPYRVAATDKLGNSKIYSDGTNVCINKTTGYTQFEVAGVLYSAGFPFNVAFLDTAEMAAGIGGGIGFGGKIATGGSVDNWFAGIRGGKLNATESNSAGYLSLYAKANGANPNEMLRLESAAVGFFGITAQARPAAYTQTYSTASRVHYNPLAQNDSTFIETEGGWGFQSMAEMTKAMGIINNIINDVGNVKNLVNSIIDDLQGYGLLQ